MDKQIFAATAIKFVPAFPSDKIERVAALQTAASRNGRYNSQ